MTDLSKWLNQVHCMDALELLAALPDGTAHLILTDPPYGIGYVAGCDVGNGGQPRNASPSFGEDKIDTSWLHLAYRATKDTGAIYLFSHWRVLNVWMEAVEEAGFVVRQCIVWDKMHWSQGNLKYYGNQTEHIIFATKGAHVLKWAKREGNIWRLTKMDAINNEGNYDHIAQKPERLLERAIYRSTVPGDIVIDPFVGSGSTAAACKKSNRNFICGDVSLEYVEMARKRLEIPHTQPMFD